MLIELPTPEMAPGSASAETDHPYMATKHRLALLRGDVELQLNAVTMLLGVAATYVALHQDERLEVAMSDARERMRGVLASTRKLLSERQTIAVSVQAAQEWRAERDRARRP